ncbi:MAG: histidinol-phosphate transaminase [Actinomycetota bacterium]|nr:histidinol-phosphate transaminase [Actinomycetota bacterium]
MRGGADRVATTGQRVQVREDLRDVEPYGAPQLDVPVRLNTNETPYPPPPQFEAALRERLSSLDLHRYPDRKVTSLRRRLAELEGLRPEQTWAANGSNEVLLQLLQAYGGPRRRLLLFRPGYSMYPLLARVTLTEVVTVDVPTDFVLTARLARTAMTTHDPDVVMFAHPNNPTGVPVTADVVEALHDVGRALVVVDEAYVEFGAPSLRPLLDDLPRLVVTRTFSKAYRLAGLRLGYLLGHDWVVEDLRRVRLPYHLDTLKQVAAECALDLGSPMLAHIPVVVAERERVAQALRQLSGVEVYPSAANFILFRTAVPDLFERLTARGVLVRDFSRQPRLEGCLRVTIGTPEEDDAFLEALADSLAEAVSSPAGT